MTILRLAESEGNWGCSGEGGGGTIYVRKRERWGRGEFQALKKVRGRRGYQNIDVKLISTLFVENVPGKKNARVCNLRRELRGFLTRFLRGMWKEENDIRMVRGGGGGVLVYGRESLPGLN